MAQPMTRRGRRTLKRLLGFKEANDGVAAIEFAFIAPVMLIMFLGVFEVGRAYSMHRRFADAANIIGDLVTREQEINASGLEGIYRLVPTALAKFGSTSANMTVEIIPIHMPITGGERQVRVYAQPATYSNKTSPPSCAPYTVSSDTEDVLRNTSFGLVIVKATYTYQPLFNYPVLGLIISGATWEHEAVFAPRQSCVAFQPNNGDDFQSCNTPCE